MAENNAMKCNLCEEILAVNEKSMELLDHMKNNHQDIYELHKTKPEDNVGYRIEFIEVDQLQMHNANLDPSTSAILIDVGSEDNDDEVKENGEDTINVVKGDRKRSWVWKHYIQLTEVLYRCNHCQGVFSVNLGRHLKNRHYTIYKNEMQLMANKKISDERDGYGIFRSSWVWEYFVRTSPNRAQCKVCGTEISGINTGNIVRHLRLIHKKLPPKHTRRPAFRQHWVRLYYNRLSATEARCKICCHQVSYEEGNKDNLVEHINVEHRGMFMKRKRSWIWNYFEKLDKTKYRCVLCSSVLSIQKLNTNNLNRHIKSQHRQVYEKEVPDDLSVVEELEVICDSDPSIKTVEKQATDQNEMLEDVSETRVSTNQIQNKVRRSWVWCYYKSMSLTRAECKLCKREISHGGNSMGNLSRHLKVVHNETRESSETTKTETQWIWKAFEDCNDGGYLCKICEFRCEKEANELSTITSILAHLRQVHDVVSGDQIVTETDEQEE